MKLLLGGAFERIDELLVLAGAERGNDERLRFAAREKRGTMRARQRADFGNDGPHGDKIAPVDALLGVEHRIAHHFGFQIVEQIAEILGADLAVTFADEIFRRLRLDFGDAVAAQMLFGNLERTGQIDGGDLADLVQNRRIGIDRNRTRFLRGLLGEADDRVDHRLHAAMAEHDRAEHDVFRQFLGFGFHHQHRIGGAGHDEIERRKSAFRRSAD